ncbi:hypothetical protein SY2F82_60090 [Streptomyces sp. Y2F8-2]|nr:hypothetical protein SY2F82_60090 [Streptomyces sp. Y2F8-2]
MVAIARNGFRPSYFPVMAHKLYERTRYGVHRERSAATEWAAEQARDMDVWARGQNTGLWEESLSFAQAMSRESRPRIERLRTSGIELGGGGSHELLYFLTRLLTPQVVLETGVAAGWSTTAFLTAIRSNGKGHLYSSDFPFFRIPDPERFVGYLVPEQLKGPWTLRLKGDRSNLDEILRPGVKVDLVHYDSDKSRGGREWFARRIAGHLAPNAVIVMDDINDNLFFRDRYALSSPFRVFSYQGKYIGVVGI